MQQAATKNMHLFKARSLNMNFDLSRSDYKAIENIGTGAYGVVCSAINVKSGKKVAIKKIPNAFEEIITAKRTFRELKILRHFDHENVIRIHEILMPREPLSEFKDVYVVMDLMESDLHQILHSNQPFSNEHTQYFLYQILRGLKYIHSANVVHRDLKPSNLLVNENCELKIGDFGMARGLSSKFDAQKKLFMTQYVATRWYRAPELLFSAYNYAQSVDMWSVGCIFAEMLSRKQLFPGKNPMDQLVLIVNVLGMPPESMLQSSNSDQIVSFFHTRFGGKTPLGLASKLKNASPDALSLLSKMLVFDPAKRISIEDALKDPFVVNYHDPDDEPICLPKFDFSFDDQPMTKEQIRQQVGKMILKYTRQKMSSFKFPGGGAMLSKPEQSLTPISNLTPASSSSLRPTDVVLSDEKQEKDSSEDPAASHDKLPDTKIFEPEKAAFVKPSTPPSIHGPGKTDSLAVSSGQVVTDVEMKSARSACNEAVNNILCIAAKTQTESGGKVDIEMKSAKKEEGEGSLRVPGEALVDVQMLSAKGDKEKSNMGLKEASSGSGDKLGGGDASDTKTSFENLATGDQGSVFKGQLDGTEDTKALIKAALKNTVMMKSKMKKERQESMSQDVKPSRKMSLALSRQREREEKRRQRQKRAKDKQRKSKGSSSEKENQGLMLTTEDRSLLEKWKEMQSSDTKNVPGKVVSTEGSTSSATCGASSSINQATTQPPQMMVNLNPSGQGITTGAQIGHQGVLLTLGNSSVLPNNGQNLILLPVASVPGSQTSTSAVSSFLSNAGGVNNPPTMQNSQQILTFTTQNIQPVTTVHNPVTTIGPLGPASSCQDGQAHPTGESVSSSSTLSDITSLLMDSPNLKLSPKTISEDVFLGSSTTDKPASSKYGTGYRSDGFQGTPSPPSFLSKSGIDNLAALNQSGPARDAATPPDMNDISDHLARAAVLEDHLPYLQLTPRGDGSGYGLGVNLEDFLYDVPGSEDEDSGDSSKPVAEAQLSASVFSGILREHDINPDDLHALHQELGLTSPITLENISQISPVSPTAAASP